MSRWIDAEWLMNFFVDIPDNFTLTIGNLRATVNDAPSIDIEPKRGEWVLSSDGYGYIGNPVYKCSVCGWWDEQTPYNYCPNCGADMRERKESE